MNKFDLIFVTLFVIFSIFLLIFGALSFFFNYLKIIKLKNKININEIQASKNLKDAINSSFWVYRMIFNSHLMDELNKLVGNNKRLNMLHSKYKYFEKLQLLSLLGVIIIFVLYIVGNILIGWFAKN